MDYLYEYLNFLNYGAKTTQEFAHRFQDESSVTRRDRRRNLVRRGLVIMDAENNYTISQSGRKLLGELKRNRGNMPQEMRNNYRFSSSFKENNGQINVEEAKKAVIKYLREHGPTSAKVVASFVGLGEAWSLKYFPLWVSEGFIKHNGKDRSASRYYVDSAREVDIPELQENIEAQKIQDLIQKNELQIPQLKEPFWWLSFNDSFILLNERTPVGVVSQEDWMTYSPLEAAGKAKSVEDGMKVVSILAGAV